MNGTPSEDFTTSIGREQTSSNTTKETLDNALNWLRDNKREKRPYSDYDADHSPDVVDDDFPE